MVEVYEGMRTPWGKADDVKEVADGVYLVGTPSHGGIKLSPKQNKRIPVVFRTTGGWYEEDCEAAAPVFFLDDVPAFADRRADAERQLKVWMWRKWEQFTGETIPPGVSRPKDQDMHVQTHANAWLVVAAWGEGAAGQNRAAVPSGFVGVAAQVGGRGEGRGDEKPTKYFLVPASAYADRNGLSFVVDPAVHPEWR